MRVSIEHIIEDDEIRAILYALEKAERGASAAEVCALVDGIRTAHPETASVSPHEMIYVLVHDYARENIDLPTLKEEIFELLDEYHMLKRAV